MGISPDLIPAIKTIKDLKSLSISFDCDGASYGTYDFNTLSGLFSAIPNLEYLSTHHDQMDTFTLYPPALSNLRYFSMQSDEENLEGNCHITQTAKNTLKMIELSRGYIVPIKGLKQVLEPIKDTLEGLFTLVFTIQVTKQVSNMNFPKLRVIKTQPVDSRIPEVNWLKAPMLKNVRTVITNLENQDYWHNALEGPGRDALKKVPNFKHLVFTNNAHTETQALDPQLVRLFEFHGVQCHFTDQGLSADEIMTLDCELNGPVI
ncbi:uncharacterized protein MELLADRAFT_95841 [Melampsora larici-populina 98AG31]|uniref:Uncharacterized protein n=1 Tax=Melampsora larici-populina (strain 98AG31 / pathotype 3-4-7) TaxID=747676 RepID=F4RDF8_MELLP|nr:uncharacterized protein MELLADRAFT_95841 [Melampsora larici-populina 98AG31]EGG09393.1 hypothetical protein MELLADRAFT_95841 [Melampsora larici-populina 98AG31]